MADRTISLNFTPAQQAEVATMVTDVDKDEALAFVTTLDNEFKRISALEYQPILDSITFTEKIKLAFVVLLREAFASSMVPDLLKYNNVDPRENKIHIHTAFPRKVVKVPAIIISAEPADVSVRYLQDDLIDTEKDDDGNEIGYYYGGRIDSSVGVTIYSYSTFEREKVMDFCSIFIRILFKYILKENNIEITGIRAGGESQSEVDEKVLYESSLTIDAHSEIDYYLDKSTADQISAINLELAIINLKNEIEDTRDISII